MIISTRGRYALRVMSELAAHDPEELIPLKDIAEHQGVSLKYLESIMSILVKNKLVLGASGKGGGYRLIKPADEYTLGEVLRATEGPIEPVACTAKDSAPCERNEVCPTYPVWRELSDLINGFLDSKKISDLRIKQMQ